MGAHVWKRDSGSVSVGVQAASGQHEAAQATGTAAPAVLDGIEHQPKKKQRIEGGTGNATVQAASAAGSTSHAAVGTSSSHQQQQQQQHRTAAGPVAHSWSTVQHNSTGVAADRPQSTSSSQADAHRRAIAQGRALLNDLSNGPNQSSGGRGAGRHTGAGRGKGRGGKDRGAWKPSEWGQGHTQTSAATAATARPASAKRPRPLPGKAAAAEAEDALKQKELELEALKTKIRQQQAKHEAATAAQEVKQQLQQQQQELQQRKNRLNNAFSSAFANAAKAKQEAAAIRQQLNQPAHAASGNGDWKSSQADADITEVARVLACKNDFDVLQLRPGFDAAALKKRYKEMAVRLHPDKCKAPNASTAFQRTHKAYQALTAYVL